MTPELTPVAALPSAEPTRQPPRHSWMVEGVFALLVGALAFLLASTPARNSDLWLHLAAGRPPAGGQSVRGTDPFSSSTAGVFWVNHSWLADAALYGLYERGGGPALVVVKALVLAGLAGLLFSFRHRASSTPLLCLAATTLSVLALGPWLLLQPTLLSVAGVALTLWLLERPALVEPDRAARARSLRWLLPLLFALWANLDGWFLLGPALVGLYALGAILTRREVRSLGLLTVAGLAACLVTPYHVHTFAWPTPLGLSHTEQVLMSDPLGRGLVVSPFESRFVHSPVFASPGAWAYYLLLAGGLASFALCGRSLHPGRFLAWLGLAALSVYQARAIPFFAVLAGPVLVLNVQEAMGSLRLPAPWRRLGTAALGVAGLVAPALLVLAWPGWLQPAPYRPRGWSVEPNGSLVRLARRLEQWRAEQPAEAERFSLTLSPEAADYLAWLLPAEKGFLDSRWPLFDRVADDFVRMRRCLLEASGPGPEPALGPLLDAHRIDRIIVADPDWERTERIFRRLLLGQEWELQALEGGASLFVRRRGGPSAGKGFDWRQQAYHPEPQRRAPPPPGPPQPPGPLDAFVQGVDERSADREEAALCLIYFDLAAERTRRELGTRLIQLQATGLLGCPVPGGAPAQAMTALAVRLAFFQPLAAGFLSLRDQGPVEALLLAIRAARRAVAANPNDGGAFLLLGEAYLRLERQTREQSWYDLLPTLATIRQVQARTALEQAVLLRPDLDQAHTLLARLCSEAGDLDRALDHFRAWLRIAEQQVRQGGPEAASAQERLPALRSNVVQMEELVERSLKIYEANSADLRDRSRVLDRARLADRHGLTEKALDMLLHSQLAIFGKEGARFQLELMLKLGRAWEVRAWLEPEHESLFGNSAYQWLRAQAAAACGDYAAADEALDGVSEETRQVAISARRVLPVRTAVALRVTDAVLVRPPLGSGPGGLAGAVFLQFDALRPMAAPARLLRQEADLTVLRGVLALEAGDVETARRHLQAALELLGRRGPGSVTGLDFPGRPIARHLLRLLEQR